MQKRCPRCGETKSISAFARNRSRADGLQGHCKACHNEHIRRRNGRRARERRGNHRYWKEYYARYADRLRHRAWARWEANRLFVAEIKMSPCVDCGGRFPPVAMQFDHIGSDKVAVVSRMLSCSRERILAEIRKCELVCANCHAVRTDARQPRRYVRAM